MLALGGSTVLLLGAFGFQHLGNMTPCKMCYWQRYPHAVAIGLGLAFLLIQHQSLLWLGALAALATGGIGLYHAGIERGLWQGPASCTSGPIDGLSTDDLVAQIMTAPMVRCDEVPWALFGISMAGWNAILSICLMAIWLWAAIQKNTN
jgi:disulfide bond formation protein DsbB